jgi:hypothetical protein
VAKYVLPTALVAFTSHLLLACSHKASLLTTESVTAHHASMKKTLADHDKGIKVDEKALESAQKYAAGRVRREDVANGTHKRSCEDEARRDAAAKSRRKSTGASEQLNKWNAESQEALRKMVEDMPNVTWGERATRWEATYPQYPNKFTDM